MQETWAQTKDITTDSMTDTKQVCRIGKAEISIIIHAIPKDFTQAMVSIQYFTAMVGLLGIGRDMA